MPFYEYECSNCRFYAEVLQKISDAPLKKCPSCGKNQFKRLISAPVFRLKGSGWYETDFKSDKENKRNIASAEKEPAAAGDGKAGTEAKASTDAKVETKSEGKADAKAAAVESPGGAASKPKARTRRTRAKAAPPRRAKAAKRKARR